MIQAYNYMLESFPLIREAKYPVNKRSDLKRVYNHIVNLNNHSPLYKVNLTKENQEYTIGVKEAALALKLKLSEMMAPETSDFDSKAVSVSNGEILSAELIDEDISKLPEDIQIKVKTLASSQVNRGKELYDFSHSLPSGEYNFTANVLGESYHLTYEHPKRIENQLTLKNVAEYLNKSINGIKAVVEKGSSEDYSRIAIVSERSGKIGDVNFVFEDMDLFKEGVVSFLGLNRIDQPPVNTSFELNGVEKQITGNAFTLENTLLINLHQVKEEAVQVKIVPDKEKIISAVESVLEVYNRLIRLANDRVLDNKEHYRARKLINEMEGFEKLYHEELSACGLYALEDGTLKLDEALAIQAALDGGMESLFTRENGFVARLLDKADAIAINPLEYLDKTIVTYPNTDKSPYRNPYITSMYSGLLFNSYC